MCTIDGTQYHSSTSARCSCCITKEHKTGELTYSHSVLQGAIMHPDKKQVIPVMPEAIKNEDGTKKKIVSLMQLSVLSPTYARHIQGRNL